MTADDCRIFLRHIYETRLGALEAPPIPFAWQHNMAVEEAQNDLDRLLNPNRVIHPTLGIVPRGTEAVRLAFEEFRRLGESL